MKFPVAVALSLLLASAAHAQGRTETIVLIRHGEKPQPPLGQLSCTGLNRALALPQVLAHFGKPAAIFVPSPAARIKDGDDSEAAPVYSYLRPLATIEPYAIRLGMAVDAQIGYSEIPRLQAEVLEPRFESATVLLVWEHLQAERFARALLTAFHESPAAVPTWRNDDYETMYVFRISTDAAGKRHLDFKLESEGLKGRLPSTCPAVQMLPPPAQN